MQASFGFGAATTVDSEECHNAYYSATDDSAFVSYFADTSLQVAKIALSSSTAVWAKKVDVGVDNSVYFASRFFFVDEARGKLYATSNYATLYLFVCKFAADDGTPESCFRMGSGVGEFPFYMSVNSEFLLIMGSSLSWKGSGSQRGTFLINLNTESMDTSCSELNLQSADIAWSDSTSSFPVYTLATSEIAMDTTVDITAGSTNSLSNPT